MDAFSQSVTPKWSSRIQSVSKLFVFALVCDVLGHEEARRKLGVDSTGLPFNSVMAIELNADRTMNPLVNAGAMATTSLVPGTTADEKFDIIVTGLSRFAGRQLVMDHQVYESEATSNFHYQGIARLLDGYGRMYCDPDVATDVYTRQCALRVTARDLAAPSWLSRGMMVFYLFSSGVLADEVYYLTQHVWGRRRRARTGRRDGPARGPSR